MQKPSGQERPYVAKCRTKDKIDQLLENRGFNAQCSGGKLLLVLEGFGDEDYIIQNPWADIY